MWSMVRTLTSPYRPMALHYESSMAFAAARDLVFKGMAQQRLHRAVAHAWRQKVGCTQLMHKGNPRNADPVSDTRGFAGCDTPRGVWRTFPANKPIVLTRQDPSRRCSVLALLGHESGKGFRWHATRLCRYANLQASFAFPDFSASPASPGKCDRAHLRAALWAHPRYTMSS